jgi:hypothetical protein
MLSEEENVIERLTVDAGGGAAAAARRRLLDVGEGGCSAVQRRSYTAGLTQRLRERETDSQQLLTALTLAYAAELCLTFHCLIEGAEPTVHRSQGTSHRLSGSSLQPCRGHSC